MVRISEQAFDDGALFDILAADGSSLTNPPAATKILFPGDDGLWYEKDSAGVVSQVGAGGGVGTPDTAKATAALFTTTSTSFATVNALFDQTVTVGASGLVLVVGTFDVEQSGANDVIFAAQVDAGADVEIGATHFDAAGRRAIPVVWVLTGITPGARTIHLRWKVSAGTANMESNLFNGSFYGCRWIALPLD